MSASWPRCWRRTRARRVQHRGRSASRSAGPGARGPARPVHAGARRCRARSPARRDGPPTRPSTSFARWSRDLQSHGVRVSMFVDPELAPIDWAADMGADRVELYTEPFARAFEAGGAGARRQRREVHAMPPDTRTTGASASTPATISTCTTSPTFRRVPHVEEVSIGHALISRAIFVGLAPTVREYLAGARRADSRHESPRGVFVTLVALAGVLCGTAAPRVDDGRRSARPTASASSAAWTPPPRPRRRCCWCTRCRARTRSGTATAEALTSAGFGVLALDLRGHGASEGGYGSLQSMLLDVQAALAWLKTRHEVNASRIGIAGMHFGATLAVLAAGSDAVGALDRAAVARERVPRPALRAGDALVRGAIRRGVSGRRQARSLRRAIARSSSGRSRPAFATSASSTRPPPTAERCSPPRPISLPALVDWFRRTLL